MITQENAFAFIREHVKIERVVWCVTMQRVMIYERTGWNGRWSVPMLLQEVRSQGEWSLCNLNLYPHLAVYELPHQAFLLAAFKLGSWTALKAAVNATRSREWLLGRR